MRTSAPTENRPRAWCRERSSRRCWNTCAGRKAQRVEHYEMAGYGCARTYAELLADKEGMQLLQTTLTEESNTDKKLTKLV